MRNVILGAEDYRFVDEPGKEALHALRKERGSVLELDRCPITRENERLRIHTYAGGRINATIAALAENSGLARVTGFGDLAIDLSTANGTMFGLEPIRSMLCGLHDADARLSASERVALVSGKRRGRLAKFQPYLPRDLEALYLAREILDIPGAANLASKSKFPVL